jgi:Protein of unknown function (DUF2934)
MKPDRTLAARRQTGTLLVMKSTSELQEQIRRRAYELYEQSGRNDGHELDDWLQAESEGLSRRLGQQPHRKNQRPSQVSVRDGHHSEKTKRPDSS